MTELGDLCQPVIELEQSKDKKGLDQALSDLRDFLNCIIP